ncbi:tyrosine-type recombinase/integrase [Actinoplanes sp. NPDC049681]|uniref:tyrosine-type recombinase/integrase n=1 Tax=Actinoplanes sp. NPDC049681 TaxID=3363905 RepID=UPI0037A21621
MGTRRQWGAIRELPSGRFQARYPDPDSGKMVAAPHTFANRKAADRWLAKKRTEIDAGTAVDDKLALRPLREWWPGYERSFAHRKSRTRAGYTRSWNLRVAPEFGGTPVRRINGNSIDDWVAGMLAAGVSASKVTEALGVLRRVLARAVRDRAIPTNPALDRSIKLPPQPSMHRPVLSPAEVEKFAMSMRHQRDQVLVRLLAYGGLRIGEALALRWVDVDRLGNNVKVCLSVEDTSGAIIVGPTKTYATRDVNLPASLISQMCDLPRKSELVFPNRLGRHLRYSNWRRDCWDKAADASGIVALPHDLRGTCASLLIDAGASVKDVQKHLGHKDEITTLRLYTRVRPGRSKDLVKRLETLLAEAA